MELTPEFSSDAVPNPSLQRFHAAVAARALAQLKAGPDAALPLESPLPPAKDFAICAQHADPSAASEALARNFSPPRLASLLLLP